MNEDHEITQPEHRPLEWSTLEEYEGDPDVLARYGGGDWNSKPAGFADKLENMSIPEMKLRRRTFMKMSGFAAVLAMAAGCEKPLEHVLPYVVQPEELTIGIPNYYSSTCQGCGSACGILAKTREGRPIKLEGNANHKINQGALCAKGQGSLLNLYDPDRLQSPGYIKNGEFEAAGSWDKLDEEIIQSLRNSRKTVILTGTLHGPSRVAAIQEFADSFPNVEHVMVDARNEDARRAGRLASYGIESLPQYHFDKSKVTVLLGSDPFTDGYSPIQNARGVSSQRVPMGEEHHFTMGLLYAFQPTPSMTGIMADHRHSVRSTELLTLAQSLLAAVIAKGASASGVSASGLSSASSTESKLGLPSGTIDKLAAELVDKKGESLVFTGGVTSETENAVELHTVVNTINEVLGNEGVTITDDQASNQSLGSSTALDQLADDMMAGRVDAVILSGTNPGYFSSDTEKLAEGFKKVRTRISCSTHLDETAKHFNYALPGVHFLENWGDAEPVEGYLSLQQPTINKLWDNREFEQSLLTLAHKAGNGGLTVADPVPVGSDAAPVERTISWREFVQKTWESQVYAKGGYAGSFIDFWYASLRSGVLDAPYRIMRRAKSFRAMTQAPTQAKSGAGLELALYAMASTGDGNFNNNPHLLELPDVVSRVCWDNYFCVSPKTAKDNKYKDGDIVEVTVNGVKVSGPIRIQPGMHNSVVAAAIGWGRSAAGRVGDGVGFNAFPFAAGSAYSGASATIATTGKKIKLADVQGHNFMRKNPADKDEPVRQIVQATSLEKYNEDSMAPQPYYHIPYWDTTKRVPDIWDTRYKHSINGKQVPRGTEQPGPNRIEWSTGEHPYVKHKWVMTIDLNACNGCNACVVACATENNIPVVGKREVLVGREMHWISIHRYYKGEPENPEFVKLPMLCQHCDNAPCETVCPVLATVHSDEGLNQQVYNRCVGTRYCANNCPYKVRRFNFYQYSQFRKGPHEEDRVNDTPLALALNPDITVRTRGIMEKCSFCANRIRHAKYDAKQKGRNIPNGELKTACQQTCPTHAITFGDALNPTHDVNAIREATYNKRGYGVLEEYSVQPNVMYLAHVWNREPKEYDADYVAMKSHGHHDDSHGGGHDDGHGTETHDTQDKDNHGTGHGDGHDSNDAAHDQHSSILDSLKDAVTKPQGVRS